MTVGSIRLNRQEGLLDYLHSCFVFESFFFESRWDNGLFYWDYYRFPLVTPKMLRTFINTSELTIARRQGISFSRFYDVCD